ncbi:MAG TPA: hypothetical protein VEJ67_18465 [Candidatus Cybelea sp.]|nr:hypothetical protein [Candidatus Cybelea sp.]
MIFKDHRRLICSVLAGVGSAFLTWWVFGDHSHGPAWTMLEPIGGLITLLLLPGLFGAHVVSGNVHMANMWVAPLGNFLFYLGLTHLLTKPRGQRR